ncbi:MAG: aminoglycoside phosphotransferase family protein [Thermomicrobiales bacterium]
MPSTVPTASADPVLTPDELLAITRRAFGKDATLQDAIPVGGGTVNEVWMLSVEGRGRVILRVAPSPAAVAAGPSWLTTDGLRREQAAIALLPQLAAILPRTICFDGTHDRVNRDWVVQTVVPGRPWSEVNAQMDHAARIDLWRQMGVICRIIHDVTGLAFGPVHASTFATWAELLHDDARGLLADAERFGLAWEPFAHLLAAVEADRALLNRVTTPALIHSDLGPRHCFVEQQAEGAWRIVGLIDLEFARFADPMSESTIELFDLMPPDPRFRDAFWAGYGHVDLMPGAERRATLYAAIALGWVATDLARLGSHDDVPGVLDRMTGYLDQLV